LQTDLFPPIEAYQQGHLKVSDIHEIYFEQSGNPDGQPVVFVHGGPGGGTSPSFRRFFDPKHYRIILFDQRGCGKSTPFASLEDNTTWHLVDDMEKLREHLGIDTWMVFGGSWGSTLSLAYAEAHPDRVTHLVLRGIFMLRKWEIDWFYQEGASRMFPEFWQEYLKPIPVEERHDMVKAYYKRLTSDDEATRLESARAWSIWEASTSYLEINADMVNTFEDPAKALPFARIECHYFINEGFMEDGQLLRDAHKIRHIPTVIVHGRYDVVCPIQNAYDLKQALPDAELLISPTSGHSQMEKQNTASLIYATEKFKVKK
jgi:proline iminopeptidase